VRDSGPLAAVQGHLSHRSDADGNSDSNRVCTSGRGFKVLSREKQYAGLVAAAVQRRHDEPAPLWGTRLKSAFVEPRGTCGASIARMPAIKTIDFAYLAEWDSQAPDLHQSQLDRVDPRESASTAGRSKMENVVYLLDPETALFRAVELVGAISVKPISDLLGCKLTQMVRFDESHWLFVDAEGLREGLTAFTMFGRYPQTSWWENRSCRN